MEENKTETKLVAAKCSQCGGILEVDPSMEAAVCKYCGTPFIVEKAINNYNVQHAHIEHADNVNIDLTGSVKSVLDFAKDQMNQSRENKKELRKFEMEKDKFIFTTFFKFFGIISVVMIVIWLIANMLGLFN